MQSATILAHLFVLWVMWRKRCFPLWLTVIVILGLAGTPLLHYEYPRMSVRAYWLLYYGFDWSEFILYTICITSLWRTKLDGISFSMMVYLMLKTAEWTFMLDANNQGRIRTGELLHWLNLLELVFWACVILSLKSEEIPNVTPRKKGTLQRPETSRPERAFSPAGRCGRPSASQPAKAVEV